MDVDIPVYFFTLSSRLSSYDNLSYTWILTVLILVPVLVLAIRYRQRHSRDWGSLGVVAFYSILPSVYAYYVLDLHVRYVEEHSRFFLWFKYIGPEFAAIGIFLSAIVTVYELSKPQPFGYGEDEEDEEGDEEEEVASP